MEIGVRRLRPVLGDVSGNARTDQSSKPMWDETDRIGGLPELIKIDFLLMM
ncbi:hypothetical protein QJS10_CPB04g00159 [Acorus calamus]|uniref:Uncharacterized protein n=1 Tax=Acorus calamus TaxID=4465 RepID=A0AAV9F0S9_ACOCL|nr:hypothetical protein QJS10_CPB04g00159 [Acorus calamus]